MTSRLQKSGFHFANMMRLLLLCSYLIFVYAYDIAPHASEIELERFRFGDYDFIFYGKEANWVEAYTICKAGQSRLAVVDTIERAKFLARTLTKTKVGYEDIWIGGRFLKNRWRWAATTKTFRRTANFPPWLSYPTQRGKLCLSLDRINHSYPIFVEKKCNIFRGFICEQSVGHALTNFPEEGNQIKINNRSYYLYHARVTWEEALAFCKQTEHRLATIPDLATATKLVALMKRTRPPFEDLWIGARRNYLEWIWVATDQVIANKTVQNGFPPWKFDHPVDKMKGCLLLDHHPCKIPYHFNTFRQHQCEEPVFIEEHCDLKKDFMCESAEKEHVVNERVNLITVDQITYIFNEEAHNWVEAMTACENLKMSLGMPETPRQWEMIVERMADMQRAFDHVWLGGRWIANEWVWVHNNRSIPPKKTNMTYPPWCQSEPLHEEDEDCLNLDRDAHNEAVIYGLNCSVKQGFVCQFEAFDAIRTPDQLFSNDFEFTSTGMTFFEADFDCKLNNSHLAVVSNMKIAQDLASIIPRDTLMWIDGKRINTIWRWTQTQEIIPDVPGDDSYPPWESSSSPPGHSMCLAFKSGYREQPFFVDKPCKEKLGHLCQTDREELPEANNTLHLNNITYYFYRKKVTWHEAMAICQSGNFFLVNVGNLPLAKTLLELMKDDNPQWTSGKEHFSGSWSWITSDSKLPKINHGYPPWFNNIVPNNTVPACLLLDNVSDSATFKGEDCLQNHSFVCADKTFVYNETDINIGDNVVINVEDVITSISKAKEKCRSSGKRVIDFSKIKEDELLKILKVENVKSLWVDVIHNEGKWVYADSTKEFQTNINFPEKDKNFHDDPKNCLTLQVTPEQQLILVPSRCSDFSRIVCMTDEKPPVASRMEKVINDTVTIIAILKQTNISDSDFVCTKDLGGETTKNNFFNATKDYFKTLPEEYKNFWLDASFEKGKWKWNDGTPVKLERLPTVVSDLNKTVGNHCLIYNREHEQLQAVSCSDKYSTVCLRVVHKCRPINSIYNHSSLQWSPEKCVAPQVEAGTVCRATCLKKLNLAGPEFHICTKGKWSYNKKLICEEDAQQATTIYELFRRSMKNKRSKSNFLFIIDNGRTDNQNFQNSNYGRSLQFVKALSSTVLLNENRHIGIALYSYTARVIDQMEKNSCYLMHTISNLEGPKGLSTSLPNYYTALKTAEQEFIKKNIDSDAAFVFFFAMRPDKGPMKNRTEIVQKLKRMGVTIVVVTVGDEINRSQLEEIATTKYNGLQLYSFKTLDGMKAAAEVLRKQSKIKTTSCPRENVGHRIL